MTHHIRDMFVQVTRLDVNIVLWRTGDSWSPQNYVVLIYTEQITAW